MQTLKINLNKLLFQLICVYAFLIPFELILEVWFGIDTVLKPYRIAALLMIGVYFMKEIRRPMLRYDFRIDIFLYLLFLYGIIISMVQMLVVEFSLKKFNNDLFQMTLYLATFFIIKNTRFTKAQSIKLFQYLTAGILLNSFYLFYNFYIRGIHSREAGFMDNPNFMALSLVAAIAFLVLRWQFIFGFFRKFWQVFLILFLCFTFIIAGSRTGLVLLVAAAFVVFFFASFKRKIMMLIGIMAISTFFFFNNIRQIDIGAPLVLVNRIMARDTGDDPRFPIWEGALRAADASWYLGLGIGQFKARFGEFYRDEGHEMVVRSVDRGAHLSAHSDYFAILTTHGIIGVLLYLFFLGFSLKKIFFNYLRSKDLESRKLYQLNLILLSSLILFGLAAEDFSSAIYWILLAFSTKEVV